MRRAGSSACLLGFHASSCWLLTGQQAWGVRCTCACRQTGGGSSPAVQVIYPLSYGGNAKYQFDAPGTYWWAERCSF